MYNQKYCNALHGALRIIMLTAASVLIMPQLSSAAENNAATNGPPVRMTQYHIHYDVNPDATYTELGEVQTTILNDMGVLMSNRMPIGMPNTPVNGKRNVEILTAYTLKKNGQQVPATQVDPKKLENGVPGSATPSSSIEIKILAFEKAEIGDTLVVSYKITQKDALPQKNIVLLQQFPKFVPFDDVEISLSAPASLKLRLDVAGIEKAQNTGTGSTQKWVWKYRNSEPERFPTSPVQMADFPKIHITSFKDAAAEVDAFNRLAMSIPLPPLSENQRCMDGEPNDGPRAVDTAGYRVASFFWGDARFLEQFANDWNTPSCVFDDGRPKLFALDGGYEFVFQSGSDWSKSYARIEELKKVFPDKPFIALAEVRYWTNYAWDARGNGYGSTVTRDGWRLFHERLENAEKVLIDSKPYASSFPLWYDDMVNVQSALDRSDEERYKTFLEGAKKYKTYYPLYFTMENYLLPKWGGSWEALDSFVKWSVENTKDIDGTSMYARLYWSAYQGLRSEEKLFKDTRATWPKMKKGFEDLMARHPKSKWNLNNFAKFACVAGDKKTFLSLRRKIGKDVINDAWPEGASLDLCEAKYGT